MNTLKVLEGSAEVAQATTVYVFTAQGSQEAGMGMDLYNSSPAVRADATLIGAVLDSALRP
jgi:acyl transferase domain-containing protein